MHTNHGPIEFELFDEDAPKTVENFVKLSGDGYYDGLVFHRVIKDFMIQGGCPHGTGTGGPGYEFEDEINDHKIVRGALAMANRGPNTNGSQFFIVTTDAAPWLDGKHTVFGHVASGWRRSTRSRASRPAPATGRSRTRASSAWRSSPRSEHRARRRAALVGGLPSYDPDALTDLERILSEEGLSARVELIEIETDEQARSERFPARRPSG